MNYFNQKSFLFLFINLFSCLFIFSQKVFISQTNICEDGQWKLIFDEEFDGSSVDKSKWHTYYPYSETGSDENCYHCRTHCGIKDPDCELQLFKDENVVVSNGTCKIIAKKEKNTWVGIEKDYSSGVLFSNLNVQYCKAEIKCKIPKGNGFWPAFWLHSTSVQAM